MERMTERDSSNLHGNAPDSCPVALLLVDMINDLEFEDGEKLLAPALEAARRTAALKRRARDAGIPVIYANDNFGRWRSDFRQVVEHVLHDGVRGQPLAEILAPDADDYFVLKPKHSAFFATTLDTLLSYLGARRLVIAGFATDICVLFTANDAYMRDFALHVPADCVAANSAAQTAEALDFMARVLKVDTTASDELDLAALARGEE
jgi:nicotinamidase-related amidase